MKNLILFVLFTIAINSFAQLTPKTNEFTRWEKADTKAAIKSIKEGALLIQLATHSKKINKMREVLANPETSQAIKLRLEEKIKKIEEETVENNKILVKNLYEKYSFSKFYVFYDNALDKIEKKNLKGIFLNENLEVDPTIELVEESFCLMREGETAQGVENDRNSLEAYIILNQDGKMLDRPFPYYFRINTLKYTFNSILDKKNAKTRQYRDLVQKMNSRFSNFYAVAN